MSVGTFAAAGAVAVLLGAVAAGHPGAGRRRARLLGLLGTALLGAHVALYLPFTVDDAYIFFRYSRNLARGLGAAYNPGVPVEGFTSPAWMLLLALACRLGLGPIGVSKLLGTVTGLAALALTFATSRDVRGGHAARSAPSLVLLAGSPLLAAWIPSGMDTPLHALHVSLAVFLIGRGAAGSRAARLGLVACLALGPLVRPETALLGGLTWLAAPRLGLARFRLPAALAASAVLAPLELFRLLYFGDLLPHTFHAKVHPGSGALRAGAANLAELALFLGPGLVALVVAGALRGGRLERFLGVLLGGHLGYVLLAGGDVLDLRIHVAMLGPAALLAEGGFLVLRDVLARRGSPLVCGGAGVGFQSGLAAVYLTTAVVEDHWALNRKVEQVGPAYVVLNSRNVDGALRPLGLWLKERSGPGDRVAIDDIGAAGWYSELPLLDMYGLVDPVLSGLGRGSAGAVDHVLGARPRWIVFRSGGPGAFPIAGRDASGDPRLAPYRHRATFSRGSYSLSVYERGDAGEGG